jgi:excinuclease ABC subunit A
LAVDEQRFADWQIRCPECDGQRFSVSTLSVRYRGRSVADVLEMSISEGAAFFQSFPRLSRMLSMFEELGLGYLKLGQPASTLSGGESQRIKLGTELAKPSGLEGATLFVLDEPTSGLHVADVGQLVSLLRRLTAGGDSVLVIEHHRELIASAAWRIDMGPGSGLLGGEVIFCGPQ